MTGLKGWIVVASAAFGLGIAALAASVGPASECSTAHEVHWWIAAPFFILFLGAGAYATAAGTKAQRLTLFVAVGMVMAGYVAGLALSLPMVFETEIGCAADGLR
jgi:hypothetical protein